MLSWTDPQGVAGSTPLRFVRGAWRGTLGPFSSAGSVPWTVTVSDAEGNTARRSNEIAVRCPVIG